MNRRFGLIAVFVATLVFGQRQAGADPVITSDLTFHWLITTNVQIDHPAYLFEEPLPFVQVLVFNQSTVPVGGPTAVNYKINSVSLSTPQFGTVMGLLTI